MTVFIEYNKAQLNAIKQLRRAWTKIHKSRLSVFNNYGTLEFYPTDEIDHIGCENGDVCEDDVYFESVNIHVGEYSDDSHWVHFSEKGKKKYLEEMESE